MHDKRSVPRQRSDCRVKHDLLTYSRSSVVFTAVRPHPDRLARRAFRNPLHRNDVLRHESIAAVDFELLLEAFRRRPDLAGAAPLFGVSPRQIARKRLRASMHYRLVHEDFSHFGAR